jgi:hypothetical protein
MQTGKLLEAAEPLPYELSLRIRHPSIEPAELSRELGLEARHSFRAGDARPSRSATTPAVYGESYWLGSIDPTLWPADAWLSKKPRLELAVRQTRSAMTKDLGWALSLTVWRLTRAKALFERLRSSHGEVSLLIGVSAAAVKSFSLMPEVSRMFSDLGITLEFDLGGE